MKKLYITVLLCMVQISLFAQYKITILDKETNEPVAYSNVYYPDSKTGTLANEKGVFALTTTKKSMLIQISSAGYKTLLETLKLDTGELTLFLEPSIHRLQEIVISEEGSKLQGENVLNVEKVSLNNNSEIQGLSLSEKLSKVPGVSNFSTGAGIGKPVIRGLGGNRVAVFSQGIRIENQQWGDEHGLGLDENGYEEVEIIKGPASLLYGSDALGGVLYFSDERYARENSIEAVLTSEFNTNTNGWRNTGGGKFSSEKFHWNAFGGYTTHKDYKDGNNDFVNNSRFQTGDFKTSFGYTTDKYTSFLKYSFLKEKYGLTESPDSASIYENGRTPEMPYQDLVTHLISSENTFFFSNESKLKVDLGYVFNNRTEFEEHEHEEEIHSTDEDSQNAKDAALDMSLGTLSYNAKWYSPKLKDHWTLIAGSQGMYQTNVNHGEEVLIPNAITADMGLFVTSDFYYAEKSYWQIGARVDGRHIKGQEHGAMDEEAYIPEFSQTYAAFNFSTGIYQPLGKRISLRANLASGYRAPNMFELLSNGLHEGTNHYEIGNPDLKTENCYQADVALTYKTEHLDLFANPYFNYIRNYIYLEPSGEIENDMPVYYYAQSDAYLYGGEAGFHFHPHPLDWLHLDGAYSSTFGQDNHHNDLPLIPSQKIDVTVRANFSGKKVLRNFFVYLQNQYSFAQNHIADYEISTGAYNLLNAGVGFEFRFNKQKLLLNIAATNLFNETYYDHLSRYKTEGIYNIGRNVNIRLTIPLEWEIGKEN